MHVGIGSLFGCSPAIPVRTVGRAGVPTPAQLQRTSPHRGIRCYQALHFKVGMLLDIIKTGPVSNCIHYYYQWVTLQCSKEKSFSSKLKIMMNSCMLLYKIAILKLKLRAKHLLCTRVAIKTFFDQVKFLGALHIIKIL